MVSVPGTVTYPVLVKVTPELIWTSVRQFIVPTLANVGESGDPLNRDTWNPNAGVKSPLLMKALVPSTTSEAPNGTVALPKLLTVAFVMLDTPRNSSLP